jgi:hypothetical protein
MVDFEFINNILDYKSLFEDGYRSVLQVIEEDALFDLIYATVGIFRILINKFYLSCLI